MGKLSSSVNAAISKLNNQKGNLGDITADKGFDPNDYAFDGSSILAEVLRRYQEETGSNANTASSGTNATKAEVEVAK